MQAKFVVRCRKIRRKRRSAVCEDCGREIAVGEECIELIRHSDSSTKSSYSCCALSQHINCIGWPKNQFMNFFIN